MGDWAAHMWPTQDLKQFEQFPNSYKLEDKYKYWNVLKTQNMQKTVVNILWITMSSSFELISTKHSVFFICLFFIITET